MRHPASRRRAVARLERALGRAALLPEAGPFLRTSSLFPAARMPAPHDDYALCSLVARYVKPAVAVILGLVGVKMVAAPAPALPGPARPAALPPMLRFHHLLAPPEEVVSQRTSRPWESTESG